MQALPNSDGSGQQLMPSLSIEAFLAKRDSMKAHLEDAKRHLDAVQDIAKSFKDNTASGGYRSDPYYIALAAQMESRVVHADICSDTGLERIMKDIDARLWDHLLCGSGVTAVMDAKARKEWDTAIKDHKVPELTAENIKTTFAQLYADRGAMFERGVIEVFRRLSWDYKTNCPRKFGKRLVMRFIVDNWGDPQMSYEGGKQIDDLRRVMCVMDGKPEPSHTECLYQLCKAAKWPRIGPFEIGPDSRVNEDGYFSIRGFKNGNCHLTFLRPDLVDQMNKILAKHHANALPPASSSAAHQTKRRAWRRS
jgi:hypothetical protein